MLKLMGKKIFRTLRYKKYVYLNLCIERPCPPQLIRLKARDPCHLLEGFGQLDLASDILVMLV